MFAHQSVQRPVPLVLCPSRVNCSQDPMVPAGLTIDSHQKDDVVFWDAAMLCFYQSPLQVKGCITGPNLIEEIGPGSLVNACALDFALDNMDLMKHWPAGDVYVFALGTVYTNDKGYHYVRALRRYKGRVQNDYYFRDGAFGANDFVLVKRN